MFMFKLRKSAIGLVAVALMSTTTHAALLFDFEGLNTGDLAGQAGFNANQGTEAFGVVADSGNQLIVPTTASRSAARVIQNFSAAERDMIGITDADDVVEFSFDFTLSSFGGSGGNSNVVFALEIRDTTSQLLAANFQQSGRIRAANVNAVGAISTTDTVNVKFTIDFGSDTVGVSVDDSVVLDGIALNTPGNATEINQLRLTNNLGVPTSGGVSPSFSLDNIRFVVPVIPEPASLAMVGLGAVCVLARGRRAS